MELNNKFILDACCGGRCFWFNKRHPNTLYVDNRRRERGHSKDRPNHSIDPDFFADFRDLPFPDKRFKLVVFDPPHMIGNPDGCIMTKKYGFLNKSSWKSDIKKGFDECLRVLEDYGILIFKWSEISIKKKEVLDVFGVDPLFGHSSRSRAAAHWFCFMKIPGNQNEEED